MKTNYFIKVIALIFRSIHNLVLNSYYFLQNRDMQQKIHKCGNGCYFHGKVTIRDPQNMIIGNNVHIGNNAYIVATGGVTIGDNTHISRNLTLYSYNHNYEGEVLPYDNSPIKKEVVIGKNVWIGMDVKIIPGITIGDGAIIGLGSVVAEDVPPLAIVGNKPQIIIKYRDEEHYKRLENSKLYGGVNGVPLNK